MGVSTSPAQSCRRRSTPNRRVDDVAGEPQSSKGPALQDILLVQQGTTAQGHKALLSHSLKELTFTQHSQSVLRTKDMNTKLLDGLEMFLSVGVMFLNSSKLEMAGGCNIYSPPTRESHLEPLPNFLRRLRIDRW